MSWDIFVQEFPPTATCISEIPDDFRPHAIGKRSDLVQNIQRIVPNADFSDPSWGVIQEQRWSIELNMGDKEDCTGFAMHVRGEEGALGVVEFILQQLKLRALDSESGDFFVAGPRARKSFEEWRQYRDQITETPSSGKV